MNQMPPFVLADFGVSTVDFLWSHPAAVSIVACLVVVVIAAVAIARVSRTDRETFERERLAERLRMDAAVRLSSNRKGAA